MLQVFCIRHAAVEWSRVRDVHRKLSPEGREQADILRENLALNGEVPALAFASDAVRTIETARIIAPRAHLSAIPGAYPFSAERHMPLYRIRVMFEQAPQDENGATSVADMLLRGGEDDLACYLHNVREHVVRISRRKMSGNGLLTALIVLHGPLAPALFDHGGRYRNLRFGHCDGVKYVIDVHDHGYEIVESNIFAPVDFV